MRQITGMLTPKGLKIRLDEEFCSQLRLKGEVTTYDLLRETENFVVSPKWLLFIVGIISFIIKLPNVLLLEISLAIIVIMSLSSWIHPLFILTRSIITSTQPGIFTSISGWFVDKLLLIIVGVLTVGWRGVLYFFIGYLVGSIVTYILNIFLAKSNFTQFGIAIQSDEKAFIYTSLRYMDRISYMDWIKGYHEYLNS